METVITKETVESLKDILGDIVAFGDGKLRKIEIQPW
jgi:hypothetical protein